jgi:two-component system LytT family response regulator
MTNKQLLTVYLVDDEALALKRLSRLLRATGRVDITGATTDPKQALRFLATNTVDLVFLDIQMPEMNGFELLAQLAGDPAVVFTTAFDQYALDAFEVNSIDYLLKPITPQQIDRALAKVDRFRGTPAGAANSAQLRSIVQELTSSPRRFPERIASRIGERVVFIDLARVTHFHAKDKLTYAATESKDYVIDSTISELENRLDPSQFFRIHRATLLNLNFVDEIRAWFAGGLTVRLKDAKRTELQVARDRVRELKSRLDF